MCAPGGNARPKKPGAARVKNKTLLKNPKNVGNWSISLKRLIKSLNPIGRDLVPWTLE